FVPKSANAPAGYGRCLQAPATRTSNKPLFPCAAATAVLRRSNRVDTARPPSLLYRTARTAAVFWSETVRSAAGGLLEWRARRTPVRHQKNVPDVRMRAPNVSAA